MDDTGNFTIEFDMDLSWDDWPGMYFIMFYASAKTMAILRSIDVLVSCCETLF